MEERVEIQIQKKLRSVTIHTSTFTIMNFLLSSAISLSLRIFGFNAKKENKFECKAKPRKPFAKRKSTSYFRVVFKFIAKHLHWSYNT